MIEIQKSAIILLALSIFTARFVRASVPSTLPYKSPLNVVVPKDWTYVPASPDVGKLGIEAPGFQGSIHPDPKVRFQHDLYEVSVYVFERDAGAEINGQVERALNLAAPQFANKLVKHVETEKESTVRAGSFQSLEAPYGASAISTLLYSASGKKSIVVVKAIVSGASQGNQTIDMLKKLIPNVKFN